jgi:two-component system OmpR family response regulator
MVASQDLGSGEQIRVLVVDDEATILEFLKVGLGYEGYEVRTAATGFQALERARTFHPHIVILDVMLPDISGFEVCRALRSDLYGNPGVIMLTARENVDDRVTGLEAGADDYVTKPFAFKELLARIRAVLRRRTAPVDAAGQGNILRVGDITLDRDAREVKIGDTPINLTAKEFDLLEMFMQAPGRVFDRDTIINRVWGYDFDGSDNVVDVYIGYLRRKLGDKHSQLLRTVRGVGYALRRPEGE